MKLTHLLEDALGINPPWEVVGTTFDPDNKRFDIFLDFPKGSRFPCPKCGNSSPVYDTMDKEWRHLNFFQYNCYLRARTPRCECDTCGVHQVKTQWSRVQSGFTQLFEALLMLMCREMPINAVSRMVGETDNRIWRVLEHHVEKAREELDLSEVKTVGMDETAVKRGHNYMTMFVDMDERRVIQVEEGKGANTVEKFVHAFREHNGDTEAVKNVCCDMSPAFIAGVEKHMPEAAITFDRYHVMKVLNDAVDTVRRQEVKEQEILKKTRYLWLMNRPNLSARQSMRLKGILSMTKLNLKTVRAYHIRENFQLFYEITDLQVAEAHLRSWFWWATHSRIEAMREAAWTIRRHWQGVLNWHSSKISNGLLEGLNSLFQAAKAKARGYRSARKRRTITYLLLGKLQFNLPNPLPT